MPTDLYRYLPTFVRMRDRLASGLSDEDTEEAVLQKLVGMLVEQFDETDELIHDILEIQDPDRCDPSYFMHLSYLLGTLFPTGGNEKQVRHLIKNLVSFYKTKGTHHSWGKAWAWLGVERPQVVELYKSVPQEIGDYSAYHSINHPLRAARIDLTTCQSYCQSYCEASCEAYCEEDVEIGTRLSRQEALDKLRYVDDYRPIQVLLRLDAQDVRLSSSLPAFGDTLGHYPPDYDPLPWMGSQVEATWSDDVGPITDSMEIDIQCISTCEVSCQGCCEAQCECHACQAACQAGTCQQDCTADCQAHCEFACEHSCQFDCTSCQASCTSGNQGWCASGSCQSGCTGESCQSGMCEGSCIAACTTESCQCDCDDGFCMAGTAQGT